VKFNGGGYGYFVTQALKTHLPSVRGHPFKKTFPLIDLLAL
jgi:hypothetical protein